MSKQKKDQRATQILLLCKEKSRNRDERIKKDESVIAEANNRTVNMSQRKNRGRGTCSCTGRIRNDEPVTDNKSGAFIFKFYFLLS